MQFDEIIGEIRKELSGPQDSRLEKVWRLLSMITDAVEDLHSVSRYDISHRETLHVPRKK